MRWKMEEVEAVLERIWDLHDKVSDAIHSISRSHFLKSTGKDNGIKYSIATSAAGDLALGGGDDDRRNGFVFVKGFDETAASMAEARSLNAIRAALEDLEDQLEFFHTVQLQQQAERDAAIARLEQSRYILAMRLADHHGLKKYKVIQEALAFVNDVKNNTAHFVSPDEVYDKNPNPNNSLNALVRVLTYGFALARGSLRIKRIGGVLGNVAVFAVSMLALLQLNQVGFRGGNAGLIKREGKGCSVKKLDVFLARG